MKVDTREMDLKVELGTLEPGDVFQYMTTGGAPHMVVRGVRVEGSHSSVPMVNVVSLTCGTVFLDAASNKVIPRTDLWLTSGVPKEEEEEEQ